MSGLIPTASAGYAMAILVVELVIAGLLVVGWVLVRLGHVRAHRALQSSMVLLNIPVVLVAMAPYYWTYVLPGLPGSLGQSFYLYPTLMLVAGALAEALGVYIILVAGTNLVPERFRFRRYKLWMRTELILWWAVVLAGIATYYAWWVQA
jgi:uncharacterized membrane protein YozB (DUF420 family)